MKAAINPEDRRTLNVDIASSAAAPGVARSAIRGLAADHSGAGAHIEMLALLVTEVVTNAVIHVEVVPDEPIRLTITVTDRLTRVEVSDPGHGFVARTRVPAEPGLGGFGLRLLERAASRWGAKNARGRFSVWFEIDHVGDRVTAATV